MGKETDARAQQQARANAIRLARDRRNAAMQADSEEPAAQPQPAPNANAGARRDVNYVDLIDRKMKASKKR